MPRGGWQSHQLAILPLASATERSVLGHSSCPSRVVRLVRADNRSAKCSIVWSAVRCNPQVPPFVTLTSTAEAAAAPLPSRASRATFASRPQTTLSLRPRMSRSEDNALHRRDRLSPRSLWGCCILDAAQPLQLARAVSLPHIAGYTGMGCVRQIRSAPIGPYGSDVRIQTPQHRVPVGWGGTASDRREDLPAGLSAACAGSGAHGGA